MSYFSAVLDSAMRERGLRQTQVAKASGIDQGQLSRYLSDASRPDAAGLEKLCNALPEDSASLVQAYVRDEIPGFAREWVTLAVAPSNPGKTKPAGADEPPPPAYSRLGGRARKAVNELIEKCEESQELVIALESMLDLTRD